MAGAQPSIGAAEDARRREVLRSHLDRLLPTCRPETRAALADAARLRTLHPGDVIYGQGEITPLSLLIEGYGVARRTTADGQEIMSGVAPYGVIFGYSSIASVRSSVEIIALTDGELAQWPGPELRALIARDVALGLAAIDSMAPSLQETVERIEGFMHQDARRRVLRILARHRQLFFCEPAILTRAHLPALVGTSREMTGRVLRQLEAEGTLKREGRVGLRLLRPERLGADTASG